VARLILDTGVLVAAVRGVLDLAEVPVEDYDSTVAGHHAELIAHMRRVGRPRGAHDLIIAATARATGRTILTTDRRARFDELPSVSARLVPVAD
jgi:tRNA(fMet)-specific endonuclease VapC